MDGTGGDREGQILWLLNKILSSSRSEHTSQVSHLRRESHASELNLTLSRLVVYKGGTLHRRLYSHPRPGSK